MPTPTQAFAAWEAAHRQAAAAEQAVLRKIESRASPSDVELTELRDLWRDARVRLQCMLEEMRATARELKPLR
ncbi:MAG TPA: hypothetical protein VGD46_06935 [Rhizobacter sp.]